MMKKYIFKEKTMTKAKTNNGIDLPGVLSFERKLETSDGLMYSGVWNENPLDFKDWQSIKITTRKNRSTQSAYGTPDDKKSKPNPVASDNDDANLLVGHDTLKLTFSLRVIGNVGKPFACDNPDFETKVVEKTNSFKNETDGLKILAYRYASNVANGRFLWRNRVCAEATKIVAKPNGEKAIEFNAYDYRLNVFNEDDKISELSEYIYNGLNGDDQTFKNIEVDAYVKLGNAQHVFPSQEMNTGEKKKVLFQLYGQAAMHNVKIGNAIRTIDNWYDNAQEPIAVEPFGAVTQKGKAYRESINDFYTLLLDWLNGKNINQNSQNYVVATLIRGGVFSKSGKE